MKPEPGRAGDISRDYSTDRNINPFRRKFVNYEGEKSEAQLVPKPHFEGK